ncbi:MAG: DUF4832 domain-containing protein [Clostridia bacterium]|nr:DUF4832 domain-containing protein [Clostridia bacterium]
MSKAFDDNTKCAHYFDLSPYEDKTTVLKNPHKGWFWHFIDNGYGRVEYRQGYDNDPVLDFPCLNHLYLRFDWGDVEKEEGVYDFSYLDSIMDKWGAYGYTFALRAVCYEGVASMNYATPEYVYKKGARCFALEDGKIQPDYADPIFLECLENFLAALGKKYNGDPRIELIDVGTIGTWGEGHTVEGDQVIYPMDVIKHHFDLHCKYFPDTFVLCNDDHFVSRFSNGQAEVQEMLDYAAARGMGVQDDSICCDYYFQMNNYDTMRAPWAFERLAGNCPNVIEMAHYWYIKPQYESYFRDGLTAAEAFRSARATFAGFHGYPRLWLENERALTEYCANRLGYWYFLKGAYIPPLTSTACNLIRLEVENRGWARGYWRFDLSLRLKGDNGTFVIPLDCDNRDWLPDEPVMHDLMLDASAVPAGEYEAAIGLFDGERAIKLALSESLFDEGFYTVGRTEVRNV